MRHRRAVLTLGFLFLLSDLEKIVSLRCCENRNQRAVSGSNFSEPVLSGRFPILGWEPTTQIMLTPTKNAVNSIY